MWNGNRGRRWREEAAMGATQSERCTETAKSSLPLRERAEDPVLRAAATSARQVGWGSLCFRVFFPPPTGGFRIARFFFPCSFPIDVLCGARSPNSHPFRSALLFLVGEHWARDRSGFFWVFFLLRPFAVCIHLSEFDSMQVCSHVFARTQVGSASCRIFCPCSFNSVWSLQATLRIRLHAGLL